MLLPEVERVIERFVKKVRSDAPELASRLRIVERTVDVGTAN